MHDPIELSWAPISRRFGFDSYPRYNPLARPGTTAIVGVPLGRVIVLLPGWGAGIAVFAALLPALVDQFEVVYCIDLPGMGLSTRPAFPRMYDGIAASVAFFTNAIKSGLHELSISDARFRTARTRTLVAHSFSAIIAVECMLSDPSRFHTLTLLSPLGMPRHNGRDRTVRDIPGIHRKYTRLADAMWRRGVTPMSLVRRLPERTGRAVCRCLIIPCVPRIDDGNTLFDYVYHLARAPSSAERGMCTLMYPGAWARIPLVDRLPLLDVPVSFFYGDSDRVYVENAELVAADMEVYTDVVVVPHASHFAFVENAKGLADEMLRSFGDAVIWLHHRNVARGRGV